MKTNLFTAVDATNIYVKGRAGTMLRLFLPDPDFKHVSSPIQAAQLPILKFNPEAVEYFEQQSEPMLWQSRDAPWDPDLLDSQLRVEFLYAPLPDTEDRYSDEDGAGEEYGIMAHQVGEFLIVNTNVKWLRPVRTKALVGKAQDSLEAFVTDLEMVSNFRMITEHSFSLRLAALFSDQKEQMEKEVRAAILRAYIIREELRMAE